MIYFNSDKIAYSQEIKNPLCVVENEEWREFSILTLGKDFDVTEEGIIDLRQSDTYIAEKLIIAKSNKLAENTRLAKQAVENGYVTFKNAQFETNVQTVSDMQAAEKLMVIKGLESWNWLSKDDKLVTLTLEDFVTLGSLIAEYKNSIWNEKYISIKTAIDNAQTLEELEGIEISYAGDDIQTGG